ncbi:MAG TPA: phosphohydrolase, partial [Deltaproteobacteria bacterium]|nr:phosphohydrolase [Deltaproteobacteria bacterium]
MDFNIPTKENAKLRMLIDRVTANAELVQLWKCANINAIDRSGINDHGEVHIRIVSNAALRILRLLVRGGVVPSVVKDYGLTADDAEVVVVLASCLHDVGIAVHRDDHEQYSLIF